MNEEDKTQIDLSSEKLENDNRTPNNPINQNTTNNLNSKTKRMKPPAIHTPIPNPNPKTESNILSFFIVTKKAKVILARQFVSLSKRQLFEFSSLFSRSLDVNENSSKNSFQISDIDKSKLNNRNNHRFVYQTLHINSIFIVLITTEKFNIFESLDILKIIHRFITDICALSSRINLEDAENEIISKVKSNAYDIIMMVDDIVNPFVGKEETNPSKVKVNLKMDSMYEKEFAVVQKDKEDKARNNIVKGIEEIENLKRQNLYVNNSVSSDLFASKEVSAVSDGMLRRPATGLNLKERLIQRFIEQREEEIRMNTFLFACQNMIQNMIIKEMKKTSGEDDSDDEDIEEGGRTIIFSPLQIMYESGSDDDS